MIEEMMRSVLEQDLSAVVLCDLEHTIVYMNPAAEKNYAKYGGGSLLGRSLLSCHNEESCQKIRQVVAWFAADRQNNMLYTGKNEKQNKDIYMVALRDRDGALIGYYEKHEYRNAETAERYDYSQSLV